MPPQAAAARCRHAATPPPPAPFALPDGHTVSNSACSSTPSLRSSRRSTRSALTLGSEFSHATASRAGTSPAMCVALQTLATGRRWPTLPRPTQNPIRDIYTNVSNNKRKRSGEIRESVIEIIDVGPSAAGARMCASLLLPLNVDFDFWITQFSNDARTLETRAQLREQVVLSPERASP